MNTLTSMNSFVDPFALTKLFSGMSVSVVDLPCELWRGASACGVGLCGGRAQTLVAAGKEHWHTTTRNRRSFETTATDTKQAGRFTVQP